MDEAGSDATLRAELANLPLRLEDMRIAAPTHLDILWGASFASGDERYARMIADFFARNRQSFRIHRPRYCQDRNLGLHRPVAMTVHSILAIGTSGQLCALPPHFRIFELGAAGLCRRAGRSLRGHDHHPADAE